jgi:hypothetical protein
MCIKSIGIFLYLSSRAGRITEERRNKAGCRLNSKCCGRDVNGEYRHLLRGSCTLVAQFQILLLTAPLRKYVNYMILTVSNLDGFFWTHVARKGGR